VGRAPFAALILLAACSGEGGRPGEADAAAAGATSDAGAVDAAPAAEVDLDRDGLSDAREMELALAYRPHLSVHPDDGCPLGAIVLRVRPHPGDPALVHIIYDHLFEDDCGTTGHVGDDEVFAVTVDPAVPPPGGIRAIRAIAHQSTPCQRVSECGACGEMDACGTVDRAGQAWPVVYSSRDKHGSYVSGCQWSCLDQCELATAGADPPMLNAGEPDAHLVEDLTTAGLITAEAGWSEQSLFHHDPWDPEREFGGAGLIAGDLTDPAFDTPACR